MRSELLERSDVLCILDTELQAKKANFCAGFRRRGKNFTGNEIQALKYFKFPKWLLFKRVPFKGRLTDETLVLELTRRSAIGTQ